MAKKKNSMALFEVISKTRDKNPDAEVLVPGWAKQGQEEPQPPAPAEVPPAPPVEPPAEIEAPTEAQAEAPTEAQTAAVEQSAPVIEAAEPTETPAETAEIEPIEQIEPEPEPEPDEPETNVIEVAAPQPQQTFEAPAAAPRPAWRDRKTDTDADGDGDGDRPMWSTDGGRLTISLNYVSCLVASIGILFLIIGAFALGRATGSSDDPIVPKKQGAIKRIDGKYYMVIQRLPDRSVESAAEARRIAEFCNANGEPAQVQLIPKVVNRKIVPGKGHLIVWSGKPFNTPRSEEVKAHAMFVQNELGAKYARKYGSRYKFRQTGANGNLAPLMYPYKKRR